MNKEYLAWNELLQYVEKLKKTVEQNTRLANHFRKDDPNDKQITVLTSEINALLPVIEKLEKMLFKREEREKLNLTKK